LPLPLGDAFPLPLSVADLDSREGSLFEGDTSELFVTTALLLPPTELAAGDVVREFFSTPGEDLDDLGVLGFSSSEDLAFVEEGWLTDDCVVAVMTDEDGVDSYGLKAGEDLPPPPPPPVEEDDDDDLTPAPLLLGLDEEDDD